MLKGNKSVSLNYQSMIGEQVAIYMSGSIPESGKSSSNKNIQDLALYEANKAECRADMAAFDALLWELEDQQTAVEPTPENGGTEA